MLFINTQFQTHLNQIVSVTLAFVGYKNITYKVWVKLKLKFELKSKLKLKLNTVNYHMNILLTWILWLGFMIIHSQKNKILLTNTK